MSNALLKSSAITMTYGLLARRLVTVWSMDVTAAVVDPVGLKAN